MGMRDDIGTENKQVDLVMLTITRTLMERKE